MAIYTLFGQPANPATLAADPTDYTMGVQFSVSAAGTLTAIWFFSAAGAVQLPGTIALFAVSGQSLVASQAASWSGAAGSGWVRAPFTVPPALAAGTAYKACIFDNAGSNFYSATLHYWDTGPGASGVTNGPLSAPNSASSAQGQDTFTVGAVLAYPATVSNAANYWVDPVVSVAVAVTVQGQQQASGRTMLRKRLLYADI